MFAFFQLRPISFDGVALLVGILVMKKSLHDEHDGLCEALYKLNFALLKTEVVFGVIPDVFGFG